MKKMNKVAAAVLAVAMVGSMAVPAFAIDGTSAADTTGTTTVKYKVTEGYTWTVPTDIDFGNDAGAGSKTVEKTTVGTGTSGAASKVEVTKNTIPDGKKLQITAKGSGTGSAFTVATGNTVLDYTVTKTSEKKDGAETANFNATEIKVTSPDNVILELDAGVDKGEAGLRFTLTTTSNKAETAGEYTGTVTYTAAVIAK